MADRYTKVVLTLIAAALVTLAAHEFVPPASAQRGEDCGSHDNPCYVTARPDNPVYITARPSDPVYVANGAREPLFVQSN